MLQCQDGSPDIDFIYIKKWVFIYSLSHGGNDGWITYLRPSGSGLLSQGGRSFFSLSGSIPRRLRRGCLFISKYFFLGLLLF